MKDFSLRVVRITRELRALQQELHWAQFRRSSPRDQNRILDGLLSIGLIEDLKNALDHTRYFLWCYIESAAVTPGAGIDYANQSMRLRQITDTLRLLRLSSGSVNAPAGFLDEVTHIVNRHVETSSTREAPQSP